jgi:hypothetical protein
MHMYVCMCVCVHVCIHTQTHTHTHTLKTTHTNTMCTGIEATSDYPEGKKYDFRSYHCYGYGDQIITAGVVFVFSLQCIVCACDQKGGGAGGGVRVGVCGGRSGSQEGELARGRPQIKQKN